MGSGQPGAACYTARHQRPGTMRGLPLLLALLAALAVLALAQRPQRDHRPAGPPRLHAGQQGGQAGRAGRQRARQARQRRPAGGRRRPKKQNQNCGGGDAQPNHRFQGRDYLLSWRLGCSKFKQDEAERFCRANGMRPVSLDSPAKEREFLRLVGRDKQRYFWTGGKVDLRTGNISWPSRKRYNNVAWSNTGGAKRPQPDNREGDERCLAVLNNFYNDGIRFHDVSCHHRKPTICEA